MDITRRGFAVGTGVVVLGTAAALAFFDRVDRDSPDHAVVVGNVRDSTHEVSVETVFDGETEQFGPRDVEPQGHWDVTQFSETGELTVRFSVDGEQVWEDTHEIPTLEGSRRSIVLLELQPDDEILTRVKEEE